MIIDLVVDSVVRTENIESIIELITRSRSVRGDQHGILFSKDSTNVGPDDWTWLARCIHEHSDGFVITLASTRSTVPDAAPADSLF